MSERRASPKNRDTADVVRPPKAGRWVGYDPTGSTFGASKQYVVQDPGGNSHSVDNLSKFCKDKGLCRDKMYKVASGKAGSHKGWKVFKPSR